MLLKIVSFNKNIFNKTMSCIIYIQVVLYFKYTNPAYNKKYIIKHTAYRAEQLYLICNDIRKFNGMYHKYYTTVIVTQ